MVMMTFLSTFLRLFVAVYRRSVKQENTVTISLAKRTKSLRAVKYLDFFSLADSGFKPQRKFRNNAWKW